MMAAQHFGLHAAFDGHREQSRLRWIAKCTPAGISLIRRNELGIVAQHHGLQKSL